MEEEVSNIPTMLFIKDVDSILRIITLRKDIMKFPQPPPILNPVSSISLINPYGITCLYVSTSGTSILFFKGVCLR